MNISHSVHNIKRKITRHDFTMEELMFLNSEVVKQIKVQRSLAAQNMKRTLFVGTKVSFTDNDGRTLTGRVIKTMRKYAKVDVGHCTWRVPMHALTKEK